MDTRKTDVPDHDDDENGLGSRIGKFTATTLDVATEIFKAGEAGVREIFSPKKIVRRRDLPPPSMVKRTLNDMQVTSVASDAASQAKLADLEKKIEIEKIIVLKKLTDFEKVSDLERRDMAETISDLEKKIHDRIDRGMEKGIAEGIAAAMKADSGVTERVLLHRIGDLESRLERETRGLLEMLTDLDARIATKEKTGSSPDPVEAIVVELESRIETEALLTVQNISELEIRLEQENRAFAEKLATLNTRIAHQESISSRPDPLQASLASLESTIEAKDTATVQKLSELESRLVRESSSILEKLIVLGNRIGTLEAAAERSCVAETVPEPERLPDVCDVVEPETSAMVEIQTEPEPEPEVKAEVKAEVEAEVEAEVAKPVRRVPVLGTRIFTAGLPTVNPLHREIHPVIKTKNTRGGRVI